MRHVAVLCPRDCCRCRHAALPPRYPTIIVPPLLLPSYAANRPADNVTDTLRGGC